MHLARSGLRARRRALAAPARERLFTLIEESPVPLGVGSLAAACGLHPNTVRLHLARLVEAGLVEQRVEQHGRSGRPAYVYRPAAPDPDTQAGAYRQLASWLASALGAGTTVREAGRRAGVHDATREPTRDPRDAIVRLLARAGFSPVWEEGGSRDATLVLRRCPIEAAAREDPATVCGAHLGYVEGAAAAGGESEPARLRAADPNRSGCRIRLRRAPAAPPKRP